jgi:multisubunit Na+/H+ antiporter MnhF subunit
VNVWLGGATALLVGLVPCAFVCIRARPLDGVVALQLAGTLTASALVLLAEGFHRPSYFTLPLVLVTTAFVGTLLLVRFLGARSL